MQAAVQRVNGEKVSDPTIYQKTYKAVNDIKVASPKTATGSLSSLYKNDSKFKETLDGILNNVESEELNSRQRWVLRKAKESLKKGVVDKNVYDAFNIELAEQSDAHTYVKDTFYNALKNKGYNAIADSNDRKFSGYDSKTATIFFDTVDKLPETKTVEVGKDAFNAAVARNIRRGNYESLPSLAITIAGISYIASTVNSTSTKTKHDKIVRNYRKEHPESKMSYNDIVKNYYS